MAFVRWFSTVEGNYPEGKEDWCWLECQWQVALSYLPVSLEITSTEEDPSVQSHDTFQVAYIQLSTDVGV